MQWCGGHGEVCNGVMAQRLIAVGKGIYGVAATTMTRREEHNKGAVRRLTLGWVKTKARQEGAGATMRWCWLA